MKNEVFEEEHYYVCHDGRELRHIRTEKKEQDGYTQTVEVDGCAAAEDTKPDVYINIRPAGTR